LVARAEKFLHVKSGETTPDGKVSLLTARCLGSCSLAPVAVMDGELAANASGEDMQAQLQVWVPA